MKAALLPDRGVVKVAGDGARNFLHGLVTADILKLMPGTAVFAALLTPQGKIIADFIVAQAPSAQSGAGDGGFFLDIPRVLGTALVERLNLYKLRAKVLIEDLSATVSVLAVWDGKPDGNWDGTGTTTPGLCYADPRLRALGLRAIIRADGAGEAVAALGATIVDAGNYEAHRIALGIPRGGADFA